MSLARSPRQYRGVRAILPPDLQTATRAPTSSDKSYIKGTLWLDTANSTAYMWPGTGNWISIGAGAAGGVVTLTGTTGGAISPSAGNINILGTANQFSFAGSGSSLTGSLSGTLIAPGSIASTTTLTAGTTITATLGNITATNGNFVSSTAGKGFSAVVTVATAAATTVVCNGRVGIATFTGLTLTNGADTTLTITNNAVTGSSTYIHYSMTGLDTADEVFLKSVVNSAGSSAVTVTLPLTANATTTSLTFTFIVLN